MHPDDDDTVRCIPCRDTGRVVVGRDEEGLIVEDCTCAFGRARIAARAPKSLAGKLARSIDIVVAGKEVA